MGDVPTQEWVDQLLPLLLLQLDGLVWKRTVMATKEVALQRETPTTGDGEYVTIQRGRNTWIVTGYALPFAGSRHEFTNPESFRKAFSISRPLPSLAASIAQFLSGWLSYREEQWALWNREVLAASQRRDRALALACRIGGYVEPLNLHLEARHHIWAIRKEQFYDSIALTELPNGCYTLACTSGSQRFAQAIIAACEQWL